MYTNLNRPSKAEFHVRTFGALGGRRTYSILLRAHCSMLFAIIVVLRNCYFLLAFFLPCWGSWFTAICYNVSILSIFAAFEAEVHEFKKGMVIIRTSTYQDCRIFEGRLAGKEVLLVVTGIGEKRAKTAVQFVLDKFPVSALVSSGFAGALNDKTVVGNIVIYMMLRCEQCREVSAGKPLQANPILLAICTKLGRECVIPVLSGRGISISRVCATPLDKYELGRDSGADVVDMESFWIGQVAAERNVPFIAVRSISDNAEIDLSLVADITAGGKFKPMKALGYFIHHPTHMGTAAALLTNTRKAGKNLAQFLEKVVNNV